MSALLQILAWAFGLWRGTPKPPSPEARAAAQAATAETNLGTMEKANAEIAKADAAGAAATDRILSDPGSLRDPDPNSVD